MKIMHKWIILTLLFSIASSSTYAQEENIDVGYGYSESYNATRISAYIPIVLLVSAAIILAASDRHSHHHNSSSSSHHSGHSHSGSGSSSGSYSY
jgi:hypothetical protein